MLRKIMHKKLKGKLKEVYAELRHRMHDPIPEQGAYLRSVVAGHVRYYGVPMNGPLVSVFRMEVCRLWLKVLRRRSHKHHLTWDRMKRLAAKWIPSSRICHPLKWFNVDGHLAKSKIKESEVPNERKRKQNKVHKGIQS